MAEDDIYGNKKRWENWVLEYINKKNILKKPENPKRLYYCKNKENFKYYVKLIRSFEVDDLSYIRRGRLKDVMNLLCFFIDIDLKNANSLEREEIIIRIRERIKPSQLTKTASDIRRIGRILFDDVERPCFFREFRIKTDISRQEARKDKIGIIEFDKIMKYFNKKSNIKAYLSLAFESLARPQEICYTKIRDVEFYDEGYAIVHINSHGKEGIKKLLSIDSYPYLLQMFTEHKDRTNKEAFLFLNEYGNQLTPFSINKQIKLACKKLKIDKPITCYSIKRFGVTYRRLQGDDDITIQKIAGWKSTKQLKTYDLSDQDDVFKIELVKRGLLKDNKLKEYQPKTKICGYCGHLVGFSETKCPKCNILVDKDLIKERYERSKDDKKAEEEMKEVFKFALKHPEMSFIEVMDKFRNN